MSAETPETVSRWAEDTFGPIPGPASIAARANKEMAELLTKCIQGADPDEIADETADVVICLYRMGRHLGFDLFAEIDRKMAINRRRTWVVKNGQGQHIAEPGQ